MFPIISSDVFQAGSAALPAKIVDWARFGSQKAVKITTAPQFFRCFGKKKIIKNDYRALKKKNAENQD